MAGQFVFLDRDGTVIADKHYLHDPADIEFLPYAVQGLLELQAMGYRFVIVTNQAGVARGYFSFLQAQAFNNEVVGRLLAFGVEIEKTYLCAHHPDFTGPCECRKPKIGLATVAAREFGADLCRSIFIGDKDSDTQFGKNCGGTTILVSNHQYPTEIAADFSVKHLGQVADILGKRI